MTTTTAVLMIIFIFTFIPLVLAEFARAKSLPTVEDYFLQSRNMPTPMVFFTIYATWVSVFAVMGAVSSFYNNGPLYMTCFAWNALFGLLYMVIGKRIWFYGKAHGYITPTDFFHDVFHSRLLDAVITAIMVIFTIPYLTIQLSGGAYLIETVTRGLIPWEVAGLLFYMIMIIYLWAGGLRAVAMADVFYGGLIFVSMLVTGIYLAKISGGISAVYHILEMRNAELLVLGSGIDERSAAMWLSMFFIIPIGALMGPQMWLRSFAAREVKTFNIMPFLITSATIMYFGSMLTGAATRVMYSYTTETDRLIPVALINNAPFILCAVLLCGIAAAALSTANSQVHALAAIFTVDVYGKYIRRGSSERRLVSVGKWSVLWISALAYVLLVVNQNMILETGTIAMAGTVQVIVPVLGAFFWKHSNGNVAALALIAGIVALGIAIFYVGMSAVYAAIISLLVNAAFFVGGSLMVPSNLKTREKIIRYNLDYIAGISGGSRK